MLYSLDEIVLLPTPVSDISSRSECNCFDSRGKLPLFIAPMSCLINQDNYLKFEKLNFNVIIPRTVSLESRKTFLSKGKWVALGLDEAVDLLASKTADVDMHYRVCIDIANGHQKRSFDICYSLKKKFPYMELMVGNIAHPDAYREYAKVGADYVRIGIGSGHVCTTSVQTGIHYPMASLIDACNDIKKEFKARNLNYPKIVADGGFGYIDQTVKAIALGADYVMLGKIAASFPEACGETRNRTEDFVKVREYYGMSTIKAQKLMHPEPGYKCKHSEGTVRWIPVISSTEVWIDDFVHALKSSMSYCNARTLDEYRGKVEWDIQSPVTFKAYIKS